MPKIAKAPRRGSRYGPFLSVGDLLGIRAEGMRDTVKVQFLPQWERHDPRNPEAVLSKRFVMADLGMTELARRDLKGLDAVAANLAKAARERPEDLLGIAGAFGPSGTREDRESIPRRAGELGLSAGPNGPLAIWGVLFAIGAALLVAGCCKETDSDCGSNGTDTDDDKAGGTDGGSGTDTD